MPLDLSTVVSGIGVNCAIIAQFENDFPQIDSAVGGFCDIIA